MIFTRCKCGFIPNSNKKKSWMVSNAREDSIGMMNNRPVIVLHKRIANLTKMLYLSPKGQARPKGQTILKGQTEGTQRDLFYKLINGATQKRTKILKMKVQTLKIMMPCWKSYLEIQELLMTLAPKTLVMPKTRNLTKLKDLNTFKTRVKMICK